MSCCNPILTDTHYFFSALARLHRLRFKLFGFETSQKQLLAGIRATQIKQATVLDIGCGPGYLHQNLLNDKTASQATGVDISKQMLCEARNLAEINHLTSQTDYQCGDFVALADELNDVDIVLLDKVVCCYPDPDTLIQCSVIKTAQLYALTYPRDRQWTRMGVALMARLLNSLKCSFRPFVHDPKRIETLISEAGFNKIHEHQTFSWLTQVYQRKETHRMRSTRDLE